MEITQNMKTALAVLIIKNIEINFMKKHITKNLVNTIKINQKKNGDLEIDIPAKIYDLSLWNSKKTVVYTGQGSYANLVNTTGGFSRTHKDYIEIAIDKAISEWIQQIKSQQSNKNMNWKVTKG